MDTVWAYITDLVPDNIFENIIGTLAEVLLQAANYLLDFTGTVIDTNITLLNDTLTVAPSEWNGGVVYSAVMDISNTAIKPIAAVLITFVMCYEIYNIAIAQNSLAQDGQELYSIMRIIFKMGICVLILNNYEDISNAFFE